MRFEVLKCRLRTNDERIENKELPINTWKVWGHKEGYMPIRRKFDAHSFLSTLVHVCHHFIKYHHNFKPGFHSTSFLCSVYNYVQFFLCSKNIESTLWFGFSHFPPILFSSQWSCSLRVNSCDIRVVKRVSLSDPSWGITVQIPGLIIEKGEKSINEQTNDPLQGKLLFKSFILEYTAEEWAFFSALNKSHLYTTAAKEVPKDGNTGWWRHIHLEYVLSESLGFEMRLLDWNPCIVRSHSFH